MGLPVGFHPPPRLLTNILGILAILAVLAILAIANLGKGVKYTVQSPD